MLRDPNRPLGPFDPANAVEGLDDARDRGIVARSNAWEADPNVFEEVVDRAVNGDAAE